IKYAILPQTLRREELIGGNGLVEMGTSVAILAGAIIGGWLVAREGGPQLVAWAVLGIAVLGWLCSRGVPSVAVTAPELRINWNPITET
ncbi:MFS transporter, partial [Acinetobacter baumannii]